VSDYPCDDVLVLTTAEQHKAVGSLVRHQILGLLNERATTITQLASALGILKGSASFHVRLLEHAGLVHVVRTATVRGGAERYYGRVARRFEFADDRRRGDRVLLRNALTEIAAAPDGDSGLVATSRARVRLDQVDAFTRRLTALMVEFGAESAATANAGESVWALTVALYPTGVGSVPT
jgi:DNA-binding transcriptional ArsR family regulator